MEGSSTLLQSSIFPVQSFGGQTKGRARYLDAVDSELSCDGGGHADGVVVIGRNLREAPVCKAPGQKRPEGRRPVRQRQSRAWRSGQQVCKSNRRRSQSPNRGLKGEHFCNAGSGAAAHPMRTWSSRRSVFLRNTRRPLLSVTSVPPSTGYSRRAATVLQYAPGHEFLVHQPQKTQRGFLCGEA